MHTDLEQTAHELYVDFMRTEWCLNWYTIDFFVEHKESYQAYFDAAVNKLRKDKLLKLSIK